MVLMKLKYEHPLAEIYLPPFMAMFVVALGFLMVSRVPYPKRELFLVRRNRALQYTFIIILLASLIKLRPTLFVFLLFLAYVTIGPLNYLGRSRTQREQPQQEQEEALT
jgi:phosphatidylserine synthase